MRADHIADGLKPRLYVWEGQDRILEDGRALLRKGDILFRSDAEDGSGIFTSGRGARVYGPAGDGGVPDGVAPALPEGAGAVELDAVLSAMSRQAACLDADGYRSSEAGSAAIYEYGGGRVCVLKEGPDYTLMRDAASAVGGWPDAAPEAFNPDGEPVLARSEYQRNESVAKAAAERSSLARVAAVIRNFSAAKADPGMALVPEPLSAPFDDMSRAAGRGPFGALRREVSEWAEKSKPVRGFSPGDMIQWSWLASMGHGMGGGARYETGEAVVLSNSPGTGMRIVPAAPGQDGPGLARDIMYAHNVTAGEAASKHIQVVGRSLLSAEELAGLQALDDLYSAGMSRPQANAEAALPRQACPYAEAAAGFPEADLGDGTKARTIMPARCFGGPEPGRGIRIDLPGLDYDMFVPDGSLKAIPASLGFDEAFMEGHCILELDVGTKELETDRTRRDGCVALPASVVTDAMTRETTEDVIGPRDEFGSFSVAVTGCRDGLDCIMRTVETGVSPYSTWREECRATAEDTNWRRAAGAYARMEAMARRAGTGESRGSKDADGPDY